MNEMIQKAKPLINGLVLAVPLSIGINALLKMDLIGMLGAGIANIVYIAAGIAAAIKIMTEGKNVLK